jgi:hypothetical protein
MSWSRSTQLNSQTSKLITQAIAPFVVIAVFAVAMCAPVLQGKVPVASDTLALWAPWSGLPHEPVHNSLLADSSLLYLPWQVFTRQALASGEWPLWDPYSFAGFPFAANSQNQLYYPLSWLLWLLPLSGAIQLLALFNICLAGWGMYLLARTLSISRVGATMAGLAFCGSGMLQLAIEIPGVASVYGWLPWMLWATENALVRRSARWTAATALLCGLQTVAGHLQWVLYSYFAVGAWVVWRAAVDGRAKERAGWPGLGRGAVILLGGIAIAAVHLAPFIELVTLSSRSAARVSSHSWPVSYLLRFVLPEYFGTARPGVGEPMVFNDLWYVGIGPLVLSAVAVAARPFRWIWFWVGMVVLALVVTYGIGPFLYARWLPGLNSLLPMRIGYLFIAGLALLSGAGYDVWRQWCWTRPRRSISTLGLIGVALVVVLAAAAVWRTGSDAQLAAQQIAQVWRGALFAIAFLGILGAMPWLRQRSRAIMTLAPVALVLTLGLDLLTVVPDYNAFVEPSQVLVVPPAVQWLRTHPTERIMPVDSPAISFNPNTQTLVGLDSVDGYDSMHTQRYEEFWSRVDASVEAGASANPYTSVFVRPQAYKSTQASLLGARYVVSARALPGDPGYTKVYSGEVSVYENPEAQPRAFLVGGQRTAAWAEVLGLLNASGFDVRQTALLEREESPPEWASGGSVGSSGAVTITHYGLNSVEMVADISHPAWLVLADADYPGWKAEVDGREEKIYTAYGLVRAVPLAAGHHVVTFRYLPTWFVPTALLSGATLVVVCVALLGGLPLRRVWAARIERESIAHTDAHTSSIA